MPRKLKTFLTDSGFFQLAVAAPRQRGRRRWAAEEKRLKAALAAARKTR